MSSRRCLAALALTFLAAAPATASFHFMQIEQVIGAVCGDVSQQAVQLRMRSPGQNLVSQSSLYVHDAAGTNPILLLDISSNVADGSTGSRVLLATSALAAAGGVTPDFLLASPIPASYLAAGRLTFEADIGTVYWSLAWGGSGYTGSNLGNTANDADGDFGPPFAGPLFTPDSRAIRFTGPASALSTTNAADYALTAGEPTLTNNAGDSFGLADCVFGDGFESGDTASWGQAVP